MTTNGITKASEAAGSQGKLAEMLGVTQQAVSKWEARGWAPLKRARQIASAFPIPLKELIDPDTAELIP
jgi:transcriptional regulator with XRE-family HTH domain